LTGFEVLNEAEATGERRALVDRLVSIDLLVLEDFGVRKLGPSAAEDFLEVFMRRHEKTSTMITTNRLCGAPHNRFGSSGNRVG